MHSQGLCIGIQGLVGQLLRRARGVLVFWLVAGAMANASAQATERHILGHTLAVPLAISADPAVAQTLDRLRAQVAQAATARVIVGLRVPFAAEGLLSAADVVQQRSDIAAGHSALLGKVPSLGNRSGHIKKFETIPFMAMEVDAKELEALAALTDITSIAEDKLMVANLAQSVPLIGGPAAWASGYTGAGRTVAVLDTGVDKTHPFLTGKVVSEACFSTTYSSQQATSICPGGATSSTAAGSALPYASGVCPAGECDHGTHVAGIVAGNNSSYSGVAKGASLIAIQVFSRFDGATNCGTGISSCAMSYTSDEILGLQRVYALRGSFNIDSVNMSLGGGKYTSQSACDSGNSAVKAAIDNLRSVNIATVIAASNDGYTNALGAPGCISTAVSVGATWDSGTAVDTVASYSNSASFLNLLAPGSIITSSIPNGLYASWQGTSMATPHVAGAWAILKQKAPAATVSEVLAALTSSGVAITDSRNGITKPRINLPAALNALTTGVSYPLNVSITGAGTGGVTSSPAGINCGATCSASFVSGAAVTLTANPNSGSLFTGWSGACTGTGTCSVTMSTVSSVSANFALGTLVTPLNQGNLTGATGNQQNFSVAVPAGASNLIIKTSGGTGDVDMYVRASAVPTLSVYDCLSWVDKSNEETCTFPTPLATTYYIMLNGFAAYSGVTLTARYTVASPSSYTISISKVGNGSGTVTSSPVGISCGASCSASFASGSLVSLTAIPATGHYFSGWSGACSGKGICALSMNANQSAVANFNSAKFDLTSLLILLMD